MGAQLSKSKQSPPPYTESETISPAVPKSKDVRKVHASSTPQWTWSNAQCREWITKVLVEQGGMQQQYAERMAKDFWGFGPTMWDMGRAEWTKMVGEGNGRAIHIKLRECKKKQVPKGVGIR